MNEDEFIIGLEMIVYVDVLFLENLFLDFIIILATGIVCNNRIKIMKFLLASAIGSVCTILSLILGVENVIIKFLISLIIIFVAFGIKIKKRFLKNLVVFYLLSFTFGGVSYMLIFFVEPKEIIYYAGHFFGTYPVQMACLGGGLGFVLVNIVQKFLKQKFEKTCEIEIGLKGKVIRAKALIDSRKFVKR